MSMAQTSKHWLAAFSELTGTSEVTNHNLARALRAAGLYTKPSKGSGHAKTGVNKTELGNFLLAQAAQQLNDAPEVVRQLRQLVKAGSLSPTLGPGNFGEALERLIGGVPPDSELASIIAKASMPHEIRLSTNPYRVDMIWYYHNKPRGESYISPKAPPFASYPLQRVTFLFPALLELARQMLVEPMAETKDAAPARTASNFDQLSTFAPDNTSTPKSDDIRRVCTSASPPGYRRYKHAIC